MKRVKSLYFILVIALCISCISISIGFSAMSTSLSVNGSAIVDPIGMIRVLSIKQENIYNAIEYSSDYSMDSINVLLDIKQSDGYAIYNVNITNLGEVDKELSNIEDEIFSNDEMEYEINGLELGKVIKGKKSINFTITFKCKGNSINEKRLNAKIKFRFKNHEDNIIKSSLLYKADGECLFNGKGNNVIGDCTKGNNIDYINTKITPFSSDNYLKNFILKFTIKDVDVSRFSAGKRDTIFNILYEGNDKIKGKYPGVLLRIEKDKWLLQGSSGNSENYTNKLYFDREELLNKEIKIIRYNNNGNIGLYYSIGEEKVQLLKDITDLFSPFDTPLTFGAGLLIDNETADRYSNVTLSDMSFEYVEDKSTLEELINGTKKEEIVVEELPQLNETFNVPGPCIFNGTKENISGDNCSLYHNALYIDSNIKLFDEENYQKDFDLSFKISDYDSNKQEVNQVTIMNAFLERTGRGYGILLRKNVNNLSLIIRDGNGVDKEVNLKPNELESIRIVRKNNNICYSVNGGNLIFAIDSSNLSKPFDVPVTFGASLDINKNPFRHITGTLSDMKIIVGQIDNNIICEKK